MKAKAGLLYLIPALICANALFQRYMAENHDLNPWKGGGFGMFAEVPPPRGLYIHPQDAQLLYRTPTPKEYLNTARRLVYLPTDSGLKKLANELASKEWVLVGLDQPQANRYPVLASDAPPGATPITITKVTVGVCQYRFDPETSEMKYEKLAEVVGTRGG